MFPAPCPQCHLGRPARAQRGLSPLPAFTGHSSIPFSLHYSLLPHTKPQFVLETPCRSTAVLSYRQGAKALRREISPIEMSTTLGGFPWPHSKQTTPLGPIIPISSRVTLTPRLILACSCVLERNAFAAVALAMTLIPTAFPGELLNEMFVSCFFTVYPARFILREWLGFVPPQPGS